MHLGINHARQHMQSGAVDHGSGRGGIKRTKAFLRHILTKKTTKRKRNMRGMVAVSPSDVRAVKAMLPYQ